MPKPSRLVRSLHLVDLDAFVPPRESEGHLYRYRVREFVRRLRRLAGHQNGDDAFLIGADVDVHVAPGARMFFDGFIAMGGLTYEGAAARYGRVVMAATDVRLCGVARRLVGLGVEVIVAFTARTRCPALEGAASGSLQIPTMGHLGYCGRHSTRKIPRLHGAD